MYLIKKVIKIILFCVSLTTIILASWSAYWIYNNPTSQLSALSKPAENIKITKDGEETKDVEYTGSVEITSVEQMEAARNDTSKPLYLKSYLSIPSLSINLQVFEGTSDRVLTYGAGTIKPNQSPDHFGNYALAAHNFADWQYSRGMSNLQQIRDVNNLFAFVSDGDYVYTYRLVKSIQVNRHDSMIHTEDDYPNQFLQNEIMSYTDEDERIELAPEKLWNESGESYYDNTEGKTFEHGKLLTLYTCYIDPMNPLVSEERIIVTGIQVDKALLEEAPKEVQNLFLIKNEETGEKELGIVENTEVQTPVVSNHSSEDKDGKKENNVNLADSQDRLNRVSDNGTKDPIEFLVLPYLKKDANFVNKLFYVSTGIFALSSIIIIFIPNQKKGDKD